MQQRHAENLYWKIRTRLYATAVLLECHKTAQASKVDNAVTCTIKALHKQFRATGYQVPTKATSCRTLSLATCCCSAARVLARKLADEKQAAINAAKSAAEYSMDEEQLEAIKQSVEQATAEAAREAARADAMARAARQLGPSASSHLQDLERLRVGPCVP